MHNDATLALRRRNDLLDSQNSIVYKIYDILKIDSETYNIESI